MSLRAVARELGMAPSALYRYYPSRDDLLTALIIEAYDAIGEAAERGAASESGAAAEREAAAERGGGAGPASVRARFGACCAAVRQFALERPHEYSLIFGSPVPGYEAPPDTIPAAARVPLALAGLLQEAAREGTLHLPPEASHPLPPAIGADLRAVVEAALPGLEPHVLARGILVWVELFGLVSFELYGHLVGSVTEYGEFFEWSVEAMARFVGLSEE